MASSKVTKLKPAWYVPESTKRQVWLEQSVGRGESGSEVSGILDSRTCALCRPFKECWCLRGMERH
jgi:hypothetical protein